MTVGRTELLHGPIYSSENSPETMQAAEWSSFLSIVDGSLNPVSLLDLDQWALWAPLGPWNWKWNQARSNYSTYDEEVLARMLVLSSHSRLLGANPIVWLCDAEPVKTV